MSFSVPGGYTGTEALLAFAVEQSATLNELMHNEMDTSKIRGEMAKDLADIKSHLEVANRHDTNPEGFKNVNEEMKAFLDKYGDVPELEAVTSTMREIYESSDGKWKAYEAADPKPEHYDGWANETIKGWSERLTENMDSSGTNDQLAMIYIKSLNERINNLASTVSGIEDSRQRTLEGIIGKLS
jgi:hypothetical protein